MLRGEGTRKTYAAVGTETFGESEPDQDTGENFLPGTAPAAHVHFDVLLDHGYLFG